MTNGEMIRMRRAGISIRRISEVSGVPESTIKHRMRTWGVVPEIPVHPERRPRGSKLDGKGELIRAMHWDQQISINKIAKEFGVGDSTVRNFMNRHGIPIRPHAEATTLAFRGPEPPRRQPMSTERAQDLAAKSARVRARKARKREVSRAWRAKQKNLAEAS